jgi:hypothetical protein
LQDLTPSSDTDRVLSEMLGLTARELEALHTGGAIEPVKT